MRVRMVMGVVLGFALASATYGGPNTITYQGSLLRADGTPVPAGSYRMRFEIYNAGIGGARLWWEDDTSVPVQGGLFSTTLGDTTPFGPLFANNAALWLQVSVDLNRTGGFEPGEIYAPRQKLSGAAWAIEAANADTLDGRHAQGFVWSVAAGTGLARAGTSNTVVLSADPTYLQRRVTGSAPAGQFIRAINANGTVVTGVDQVGGTGTIMGVAAGTGLLGGGTSGSVSLSADTTYLQRRVTGAAPANQLIRAIRADGTIDSTAVVTGVFVGPGLTGSGTSGSVALQADVGYLQRRVVGAAGLYEYIRQINADGTVLTGIDRAGTGTITGVVAGTGLSGGGTSGAVTLSAQFGGSGTSTTLARSDHQHWNGSWIGNGVGLILNSLDNTGLYAIGHRPYQTGPGVFGWNGNWGGFGVYGRSDDTEGFGVAAHNYWNGTALGAWSYSGDIIRGYAADAPDTAPASLRFKVDGAGNVAANGDFQYSSTHTFYANYDATDMAPVDYSTESDVVRGMTVTYMLGGGPFVDIACGVHLPQGATVTRLDAWVFDNDASGAIDVTLFAIYNGATGVSPIASVSTTNAFQNAALQQITTIVGTPWPFDNSSYHFSLRVHMQPSVAGAAYIYFSNVRITYTMPKVAF